MRSLKRLGDADLLIRERVPFRSRVRLINRLNDFDPTIALSGTFPCGTGECLTATSKGFDTRYERDYWRRVREQPDAEHEREVIEGSVEGFCHTKGNLPAEYRESLSAADYVVRSYATPIAWHINAPSDWADVAQVEAWISDTHPGVWIIPKVSYSITTSGHQSQVEWALHGHWRMPKGTPPLAVTELSIEGAPTRVPSGSR